MPDPIIVTCTKETFKLVAANVLAGQIHRLDKDGIAYYATYREAGNPAPVAPADVDEAVRLFIDSNENTAQISSHYPIDVYIYVPGDVDGTVRVDV